MSPSPSFINQIKSITSNAFHKPSQIIPNMTQNPSFLLYWTLWLPCQIPFMRLTVPLAPVMLAPHCSQLPLLQTRSWPNRSCLSGSFCALVTLTSSPTSLTSANCQPAGEPNGNEWQNQGTICCPFPHGVTNSAASRAQGFSELKMKRSSSRDHIVDLLLPFPLSCFLSSEDTL